MEKGDIMKIKSTIIILSITIIAFIGVIFMSPRYSQHFSHNVQFKLTFESKLKISFSIFYLDISLLLSAHAFIASMIAALNPFRSNSSTASIVVPPGEHTASFSAAGCVPDERTIRALPSTLCAAIS